LLVVQDGSGGIPLILSSPTNLLVGETVEAVGFPDGTADSVFLSGVQVRRNAGAAAPSVLPMEDASLKGNMYNGRLVQLAGELLEERTGDGEQILELQIGHRVIKAGFFDKTALLPSVPVGSEVQVTGVLWDGNIMAPISTGEFNMHGSGNVLLRSRRDVMILQLPPWWAWKHATIVIGTLMLVLVVALVWIRYLRLKVARRTQELKEMMSRLKKETGTAATLAERNRLAGEIHDGMEQGLSAIMMQLDGLESKLGSDSDGALRHLELARRMVRFSRTEVRHSLWDWHSPALAGKGLGVALVNIAQQMSPGSQTHIEVNISGEVADLPTGVEHHLLRIAQECLNNAFKYAQAGNIELTVNYGVGIVQLVISDNGRGFDPETVLNGNLNGHFGLKSLQSRTRKMGGRLSIKSSPGLGTRVEVSVPVSEAGGNGQDSNFS
jgi:signal transduction histidine kinase